MERLGVGSDAGFSWFGCALGARDGIFVWVVFVGVGRSIGTGEHRTNWQ
jgi:hypothetical protein